MLIAGQPQRGGGVKILAAERKAQAFDRLAVGDEQRLLSKAVHQKCALRQEQVDRHQGAGDRLTGDAGGYAGVIPHLGQKKQRQRLGQRGNVGGKVARYLTILRKKQQLCNGDGVSVRHREALNQGVVQHGIGEGGEQQRPGIARCKVAGNQGPGQCAHGARPLDIAVGAGNLRKGGVGGYALMADRLLHGAGRGQQLVQLGADPRVGGAAALLVLQQQGVLLLVIQRKGLGQALKLLLPGCALAVDDLVQGGTVDGGAARQLCHRAGIAGNSDLDALRQFTHEKPS